MKKFRVRTGPFEYRLMFTISEIDEMCLEALVQAKCLPGNPEAIRIERFVEKHFTSNVGYEDLDDEVLGYTTFKKDGSIQAVRVSSKLEEGTRAAERRVRSTWAHEAGHCLLHPLLFMEDTTQTSLGLRTDQTTRFPKKREFLCRDADIKAATAQENQKQYDGRWWEWQANRAIGGFLLPKNLVRTAIAGLITPATQTLAASKLMEAERLVAEIFEVNPVVAHIRLTEMFPDPHGQQGLLL
jgi:hypothetical protein